MSSQGSHKPGFLVPLPVPPDSSQGSGQCLLLGRADNPDPVLEKLKLMFTVHVAQNPAVLSSLLSDLPPLLFMRTGQQDLLQRGPSPPEDAAWALPRPGQPAWGESGLPLSNRVTQVHSFLLPPQGWGGPGPSHRLRPPKTRQPCLQLPLTAFSFSALSFNDSPSCLLKRHIKDSVTMTPSAFSLLAETLGASSPSLPWPCCWLIKKEKKILLSLPKEKNPASLCFRASS